MVKIAICGTPNRLGSSRVPTFRITAGRSGRFLTRAQNWAINVLAVVSWLGGVEEPPPPPPPPAATAAATTRSRAAAAAATTQRAARLADPSTPKRVLLTVFADAASFAPRVGAPVLLVGVKNHGFDGGCLKKYASDAPPPPDDGEDAAATAAARGWWFEEPRGLPWCDVEGLRRWWDGLSEVERAGGARWGGVRPRP